MRLSVILYFDKERIAASSEIAKSFNTVGGCIKRCLSTQSPLDHGSPAWDITSNYLLLDRVQYLNKRSGWSQRRQSWLFAQHKCPQRLIFHRHKKSLQCTFHSRNFLTLRCCYWSGTICQLTEVAWDCQLKFESIILMMGNLHTFCKSVLSIIGKVFRDAGIRDLAVESGVKTEGRL
jgi:hypothetical protein